MKPYPQIIAAIGPTASGKSDFAVNLAQKVNGEIISADSRQIYKGLDIGTGKITKEEMKGIKHYMLDICDIGEDFSVAKYVEIALPIIEDCLSRGKTPILCGGTGQYIHAILYKTTFPKVLANEKLRNDLEKKSIGELFLMLKEKDETRANNIDKNNKVRLIRALEILSELKEIPQITSDTPRFNFHIHNMDIKNEIIKERITERLEKRLKIGLLDEVKNVLSMDLEKIKLEHLGLEYVELGKYIKGETTLENAKEILITKSYQYAKRQKTWNKKHFASAENIEIKN